MKSEFYPYIHEKFGECVEKDGSKAFTIKEKYKEFGITKFILLQKLDNVDDLDSLVINNRRSMYVNSCIN